jgi:hypothetical protein
MVKAEHTDPSETDSGPGFLAGGRMKKLHNPRDLLTTLERNPFMNKRNPIKKITGHCENIIDEH